MAFRGAGVECLDLRGSGGDTRLVAGRALILKLSPGADATLEIKDITAFQACKTRNTFWVVLFQEV